MYASGMDQPVVPLPGCETILIDSSASTSRDAEAMRLAALAQLNWLLGLELSDQLQPAVLVNPGLNRITEIQLVEPELATDVSVDFSC